MKDIDNEKLVLLQQQQPELYDQTLQAYGDPSGNLMLERVQGI